MIKISGKMDKSNTYKGPVSNISFFDISIFPFIFIILSDSQQSTISPQ